MRADKFSEADIVEAVAYEQHVMHWVVSGGNGRSELLAAARAGDKARWADRVELPLCQTSTSTRKFENIVSSQL